MSTINEQTNNKDFNSNKEETLSNQNNEEEEQNQKKDSDNNKIVIVPFKDVFLKIFKGNHYYILDRYRYDISTIMMLLDLDKINKLHDFYSDYPDGIERSLFVKTLEKELPNNLTDPTDQTNLVYGLYKFFCEIDFNGDGQMQWEEFTQFIIDTVEGDNDAKLDEVDDYNKNQIFNAKKMIKYKRYHVSTRIKDNLIHKKDVISAVFIPRSDIILANEYSTKVLKVYNPKTGHCNKTLNLENYLNPLNYLEKEKKHSNSLGYNKYKKEDKKSKDKKKEAEKIPKALSYSVLSMTHYQNLVAICLSDRRIIFFHFASDDRIELIHEMHMPTLEKRVWFLPEHNIWFSSGCKLDKYSYYTLNELDIEFEHYNQKYKCLFNENHPYRKHYCDFFPHRGEIMDCIEILKPMMILTACLDGKIRLINLNDRDIIKVWSHHNLGVRSLDYNPLIDNVGYVLSVGFEYFINVYCTDLSLEDAFKGKLEGHYAPVISCKFLSNSYMAVSVDEEANVRIWDTKVKSCLQLIVSPKKNFNVTNLLSLAKYNKFMVYGNKVIYYDANYKEEENEQKSNANDDNFPIKIEFNRYYQQFFVTTFRDIRVYTKEGNLFKTYKKLISNEHFDSDTVIKDFLFENNYRKFYLGFSNGAIMQFNAGNGSLIKAINEHEIEKDGTQVYSYSHSKDISSLYYFYDDSQENLLLISTGFDSLINIYDEGNSEETEQLRTIRGGHTILGKPNEITCLAFSKTLNLFATGSSENLIVIWDFEMSKLDDVFSLKMRGEKGSVKCLKFLDPYPILVSTYTDGTIYFWGVRQCKDRGMCILRARNYHKYHGIDITTINCMDIYEGILPEMRYSVPLRKYFDENSPFANPNKIYEIPRKKANKKNRRRASISENSEKKEEEEEIDEELNLDIVPNIYKNEIIDTKIDSELYFAKKDSTLTDDVILSPKYYLFLGDSYGNVKALDLIGLFKKNRYEPASQATIKSSFNIKKKEDINAETLLNHNYNPKGDNELPKYTNLYYKMIRNEFKAHSEGITCLTVIKEPLCFVTGGRDKFVKIWDMNCLCLGVINALPKLSKFVGELPPWKFKVNEEKILEDEIAEVVGIFEDVGVEPIEVGSKMDKEVDKIQVREKMENTEQPKKEIVQFIKRKFKKLEKTEQKKDFLTNDNKVGLSYEGFFVQNAQKHIETLLEEQVPNIGINEITKLFINNLVETDKEKNIERKRQREEDKSRREHNIYTNDNIRKKSPKLFSSNKMLNRGIQNWVINSLKSYSSKTQNSNTNDLGKKTEYKKPSPKSTYLSQKITNSNENPITKLEKDNSNKDIKENSITEFGKHSTFKKGFQKNKEGILNLRGTMSPTNGPIKIEKKEKLELIMPEKLELDNIKKKFKSFKSNKSNNILGRNYNRDRNTFYSEKLFGKSIETKHIKTEVEKKEEKMKNIFEFKKNLSNLHLPFLNENIIFHRGETEKLLNLNFYKTSYKACVEINKQIDMPNSCIRKNYRNNWKLVKQYAKDIKSTKIDDSSRKKSTSYDFFSKNLKGKKSVTFYKSQ